MNEFLESLADPTAERLTKIEQDLAEIRETLTLVKDTMLKADAAIATIAAQVMPTIDQLTKSPLIKMLGMK